MFTHSKGEKAVVGIFAFIMIYSMLTYIFSIGSIFDAADKTSAFFACIPYMWPAKLLLSGICVIPLLFFGHNLNEISATRVGNGQHGTARWASKEEKIKQYPEVQPGYERQPGFVIERESKRKYWKIDTSDQNLLLISPPGGGKTKRVFIPTILYNGAVNRKTKGKGASMLILDCKGEELSTCGRQLEKDGYRVLYLDFRYPLKSFKVNLMNTVNEEIDKYKSESDQSKKILHYARAERYAKILSASIVKNVDVKGISDSGQFFNETSEGLITALILLVSEYGEKNQRHIISVFKLLIELNGLTEDSTETVQKNRLEELLKYVDNDRIMNFAGPSMKADVRTSMNIFSSALGKLVSFIDAELEQMVCEQSPEINDIDFIKEPTAIFLVVPDENTTRHFFASLFIRYLMNDLIEQANENPSGELSRQVLCLWDEFGNMPPIKDIDVLFTAVRSRGIRFMIALQSYAQLEKNYDSKMAKILRDACQITMFSYMSPSSRSTAEELSKTLDTMTVQSGSISAGSRTSTNLNMIARPLMTPGEIIGMPKGTFVVMKGGCLPVKVKLDLYWNYIKKLEPFTRNNQVELSNVSYLTSDEIKNYVARKKATLKIGMFDD